MAGANKMGWEGSAVEVMVGIGVWVGVEEGRLVAVGETGIGVLVVVGRGVSVAAIVDREVAEMVGEGTAWLGLQLIRSRTKRRAGIVFFNIVLFNNIRLIRMG